MKHVLDILKLEYDLNWRPPILGIIYATFFAIYLSNLKYSAAIVEEWEKVYMYVFEMMGGYMYLSIPLIAFIGYVYSRSIAGSISSGLMKTILSYPVKRKKILAVKFTLGYLIFFIAGILPMLYSWFLYGIQVEAFISVTTTYALKLFFYTAFAISISLMARESLASLTEILFSLYIVESLPSFLYMLKLDRLAKIVNVNMLALILHNTFTSDNPLATLIESDGVYIILLYSSLSVIFTSISIIIFQKMDLD